ncbi:MAG TPA: hypothetical protein VFT06_00245 [Flavisolibacter sp.]|nr:hypothetical protein [Flavisolibacter sp.]
MPGSSAWLANYRLQFYDYNGEQVTIDIEDRASGNGTAAYTPLDIADNALTIQTVNNSQDPFSPVCAKNAIIRFASTSLIDADTFSAGTDNRFFVEIYTASVIIFRGFLLMDDIEEDLQNPEFGNVVTLVATDNLGTLKELELVNPETEAPLTDAHYSLLEYLQFSLARTGLSLNLNIVFNCFEEGMLDTASPLDQAYLYSLTFEKEIGTKEDCYAVLQKIVSSLKCRLFQYNGEWWMVRLHEHRREADTVRVIKYDPAGDILSTFADVSTALTVQAGTDVYLINADARKETQRPHKLDKDTYRYEFPREIIRNIDFSRGTFISGTNPKLYTVGDWTTGRFSGSVTVTPYIRKNYDSNDRENERWVVIPAGSGSAHYIQCAEVPLHELDKFDLSIDWRLNVDIGGNSGYITSFIAQVRLYGEDGTYWTLHGGVGAGSERIDWVQCNSSFTTNQRYIADQWARLDVKENEWRSVSIESAPLPVDGSIFILLIEHTATGNKETHFSNLGFDYIPSINGTYQKYNGQYNKVEQVPGYKAKSDNEVAISDSPKKLFKGALKKFNFLTGRWQLMEDWTDGFDAGASGTTRLGEILNYDVWNQYKTNRRLITGTIQGIGNAHAYCLLFQRITFADYSATGKGVCLHYDLNVGLNEARGEFIEVHDTGDSNDYTTAHEFNYVQ